MRNFATVIEGYTANAGYSDLSRSHFCQSIPKTPMKVGTPWATIGWTANYAGQQGNTDERLWAGNSRLDAPSIWGGYRMVDRKIGNPTAEKEARLRSQHYIFSKSRMGWSASDAHVMGVAVALRLHSDFFGGEAGLNNQSSLWKN